jgi:hypothetical protein
MPAPLTLQQYFTGPDGSRRDLVYFIDLTDEIRSNAETLLPLVDRLLARMEADGVRILTDAGTRSPIHSGWRPPTVNDHTANAGKTSNHLKGLAVDLLDTQRKLGTWAVNNLPALQEMGLWMEDPRWCPTWLHVQCVPPISNHLVYQPSSNPPLASALPGQQVA